MTSQAQANYLGARPECQAHTITSDYKSFKLITSQLQSCTLGDTFLNGYRGDDYFPTIQLGKNYDSKSEKYVPLFITI